MSYLSLKTCIARTAFILLCITFISLNAPAQSTTKKQAQEYYQVKVYHYTTAAQESTLDNYFKTAYVPALHKAGVKYIGVFKAMANDTAADKRFYIFFAAPSLEKLADLPAQLQKDAAYMDASKEYMDAPYNNPPFTRVETILLKSFPLAPQMGLPRLKSPKAERVYELRSYEGPTEALYRSKVKMFNQGGEIGLFKSLNFNSVFYAEVISGSRMPNLMYMTSFENMPEREAHWKDFFADPVWKTISAMPEYQHTVSKADIIFLKATEYSDL